MNYITTRKKNFYPIGQLLMATETPFSYVNILLKFPSDPPFLFLIYWTFVSWLLSMISFQFASFFCRVSFVSNRFAKKILSMHLKPCGVLEDYFEFFQNCWTFQNLNWHIYHQRSRKQNCVEIEPIAPLYRTHKTYFVRSQASMNTTETPHASSKSYELMC